MYGFAIACQMASMGLHETPYVGIIIMQNTRKPLVYWYKNSHLMAYNINNLQILIYKYAHERETKFVFPL